jgi:transposase
MRCEDIEATTATQVRTILHKDVIEMYKQDIENGAVMPAIDVFAEKGSARHILADGFHRLLGTINAGHEEILVDVHEGGMHEALAHALQANRLHGLRRSNADKIHAVQMALKDPEFSQLKQDEIADLCGVSRATVNRVAVRETTGREDKKKAKAAKATADDHRPTKAEPTQAEVELAEVREALSAIKVLPYDGDLAQATLAFDKDDIADLEYVSTWCAHAVLAYRTGDSDGKS